MFARHSTTRTLYTLHGSKMWACHVIDATKKLDGSLVLDNVPVHVFYKILTSLVKETDKVCVKSGGKKTVGSIDLIYKYPRFETWTIMQTYAASYVARIETELYTITITICAAELDSDSEFDSESEGDVDEGATMSVNKWHIIIKPKIVS